LRGWGCRFRRGRWNQKVCVGCFGSVVSYLWVMLHIIVIVAFVGIGAVCHMIGDKNTIYRE
jgi:hypothetical protein